MKLAYVDTSCLVAIAFDEPGSHRLARRLEGYDRLLASNLLEAELRSAFVREKVDRPAEPLLTWMTWVHANRPLTPEYERIIRAGYIKGADMWHLAHAIFLAPDGMGLDFMTLDQRQREVASMLGLGVP
ncbi:MAG TPA: PIN domain-containing protein [bacterium]